MEEHKSLYLWSLKEADFFDEKALWRESHKENCKCARAIEQAIKDHYSNNCLEECAEGIIKKYGFNRVNWVLANTIQKLNYDGRFSASNKKWAARLYIPNDSERIEFMVGSHPGLVDLLTNQVRSAWEALHLFDVTHCLSDDDNQDYTEKVVVINPSILKDEFKSPEYQLFYVEGGFGAQPNARGRKVFGTFLLDGERTYFNRNDILGILKEEYLPEWVPEKVNQIKNGTNNENLCMGGI